MASEPNVTVTPIRPDETVTAYHLRLMEEAAERRGWERGIEAAARVAENLGAPHTCLAAVAIRALPYQPPAQEGEK